MRRNRRWTFNFLLLLLFGLPFVKYTVIELRDYTGVDWRIFYDAAKDLAAGESPYPEAVLNQEVGAEPARAWGDYLYPPLFARLLIPFTRFSEHLSGKLFLFLNFIIYFALFLHWRLGLKGDDWGTWVAGWLGLFFFFGWGPSISTFRFGQSNLLPLLLIWTAWAVLRPSQTDGTNVSAKWEWAAGFLLGAAAGVKLTAILFLPILIATKRLRFVAPLAIGFLAAAVLSGPVDSYDYFTKVLPTLSELSPHHIPFVMSAYIGKVPTLLLFLVLLGYLFKHRDRFRSDDLILIGCFAVPLFSGIWAHHYMLAILPIVGAGSLMIRDIQAHDGDCATRVYRLLLFLVVLIPGFFFWAPTRWGIGVLNGVSPNIWPIVFIASNALGFLFTLSIIRRRRSLGDTRDDFAYTPPS